VFGAGSTTFGREDVSGGFEPDQSFYFSENAGRVRGKKRIDLNADDPPPDVVVEVDVTSPSLDKLPVYARLGVREVWRYADGRRSGFCETPPANLTGRHMPRSPRAPHLRP